MSLCFCFCQKLKFHPYASPAFIIRTQNVTFDNFQLEIWNPMCNGNWAIMSLVTWVTLCSLDWTELCVIVWQTAAGRIGLVYTCTVYSLYCTAITGQIRAAYGIVHVPCPRCDSGVGHSWVVPPSLSSLSSTARQWSGSQWECDYSRLPATNDSFQMTNHENRDTRKDQPAH